MTRAESQIVVAALFAAIVALCAIVASSAFDDSRDNEICVARLIDGEYRGVGIHVQ